METPKPRSRSSDAAKKLSPRVARQLKVNPVGFGSSSPASPSTRTPKDRCPKIIECKSTRSPLISEKKRPSRVTEFETQICALKDDLKRVKDELSASKASKEEADIIAEGLQQHLSAVSSKLEDTEKQLSELRASKEADVAEHIKYISAEKDRALDEIHTLKKKLEMVTQCDNADDKSRYTESTADIELQSLKLNLSETLLVLENMKTEMQTCKESEALAQGLVQQTLFQLEEAKQTVNALTSDGVKAMESYSSIASELEESKARVAHLEDIVNKLSDRQNEQAPSTMEAELETELMQAKSTIEELKANLMDKETELQGISEENECLNLKLRKSNSAHQENNDSEEITHLKAKIQDISEEAEKSKRKAERAAEQLEAAQAANAELEAELRRLKVQSDQWRKAAEAAASMLSSPVGNGRFVQRTASLDIPVTRRMSSPYMDDYDEEEDDEDVFKKKNGNVLRKIGGFWKKPQK